MLYQLWKEKQILQAFFFFYLSLTTGVVLYRYSFYFEKKKNEDFF